MLGETREGKPVRTEVVGGDSWEIRREGGREGGVGGGLGGRRRG